MKTRMKLHHMPLFAAAAFMGSTTSQGAVLLAGFTDSGGDGAIASVAANTTFTGITATFSGTGRGGSWGSGDGTYGTSASGATATAGNAYRSNEGATFVITNNTGNDVSIEMIAFDHHNNDESTRDYWDSIFLTYVAGDLGITDGTLINSVTGLARDNTTNGISNGGGDFVDFDWSLTGLADYTLADGQSATFLINSTATDTPLTNVRNFGVLDNVGFIGTVGAIPEPSAALLGGLGLLALLRRRRN